MDAESLDELARYLALIFVTNCHGGGAGSLGEDEDDVAQAGVGHLGEIFEAFLLVFALVVVLADHLGAGAHLKAELGERAHKEATARFPPVPFEIYWLARRFLCAAPASRWLIGMSRAESADFGRRTRVLEPTGDHSDSSLRTLISRGASA